MRTEDEALRICREAVRLSSSDDVVAFLSGNHQGATRFAMSQITQNVAERNEKLSVRVAFGKRRGEATVNRFDPASVREVVARAEAIAKLAPEDDEHLPPVAPGEYPSVPEECASTVDVDPEDRARGVAGAIAAAGADRQAAGAFTTANGFVAFANSAGAEGFHTHSMADVHATVLTGSSSGWAGEGNRDRSRIDPERAAREATARADLAREPREVEPAEVPVVLAPAAVAELLAFFLFAADAKAADEERSAFAGREGSEIAAPAVTLRSTLDDEDCPGYPFDGEGAPHRDLTWVEHGVLKTLRTSRFWAEKSGRPYSPYPGTLEMEGTDRTTEDLIREMGNGIYVTRFWYTRFVDPMQLLLTGMTRDALFVVEDGKIAAGAKHLRYNDSPLRVLSRVRAIGKAEPARMMFVRGRIPPLLVDGFRFTSKTSF